LMRAPVVDIDVPVTFFDFDDGDRPRYIHMGWRANPRVE